MDSQTIVALVAAVIATVAAGFAWWQAAEARKSRVAAERQATAAEQEVKEAREANDLTRQQLDVVLADQADRRAPRISVVCPLPDESDVQAFYVMYDGGPSQLESITVSPAANGGVVQVYGEPPTDEPAPRVFGPVVRRQPHTFWAQLERDFQPNLAIFQVEAEGDGEVWPAMPIRAEYED